MKHANLSCSSKGNGTVYQNTQVEIIILYSTGNRFKCIAIHIVKKYKFTIFAKIYKLKQLLLGNTLKMTLKYHTHCIYLFIFNVHCRIRKRTLASP
jgi:hypothetical protein